MSQLRYPMFSLMMVALLSLTACGGGGGSANSVDGPVVDPAPVTNTVFETKPLANLTGGSFSAGVAISSEGLAVGFGDNGTSVQGMKWDVTTATPAAVGLVPIAGNLYSAAYGVNASGVAVGESGIAVAAVADANTVAVYWVDATPAELDSLGLFEAGTSAAYGINADGEIVGEGTIDAEGTTVAVYWATSAAAPLKLTPLVADTSSAAYFINDAGMIVGESLNTDGSMQAVAWMPDGNGGFGAPVSLAAIANQVASVAFGIDLDGRIVGEAELADGTVQGMIWSATGAASGTPIANTSLQAVNNEDRIVGYNDALSGNDRAQLLNAASLVDTQHLAAAFSQAYAINDNSQIVGVSDNQAFAVVPVVQ